MLVLGGFGVVYFLAKTVGLLEKIATHLFELRHQGDQAAKKFELLLDAIERNARSS
jgi:hypothetical protein